MPATKPERIFSDGPPSRDEMTTSRTCPDSVEVKFGIKVTGTADWLVAKAATEGNFEVTLKWGKD